MVAGGGGVRHVCGGMGTRVQWSVLALELQWSAMGARAVSFVWRVRWKGESMCTHRALYRLRGGADVALKDLRGTASVRSCNSMITWRTRGEGEEQTEM